MKYKLGELCTVITDGSHNPPKGTSKSEYLMLSSKNVQDDCITFEEPRYLSSGEYEQENKRTTITAGDVLLTIVGTVGRCAVVPENCGYLTLQRSVAVLKPRNDICKSRYLMYALISKRALFETEARGVAQKGIYLKQLSQIEIPVPNPQKQEEIISLLDKAQSIISARKQQITELDNLIKARFVEMFGDMLLNEMGWKEFNLDTLADVVSGITKGRKVREAELIEVPYMAVSNVKDGYIDWTTVKTIMATQQEIEQYRLLPYDVLMTEGGDPDKLGRGAVIVAPLENSIHQNHIFRVRLQTDKILPIYFSQYLQNQKAKKYFLGCAKQTTGIASINMKQLRSLPVLVPPIEQQEQFAAFVEQVDKSKVVVQKALDEAQTLFDSLMQEYFG